MKGKIATETKENIKKIHPWRLCPVGAHWVKEHSMRVKPSKLNPDGYITTRRAHCAQNPSKRDMLYPDEIKEISDKNFSNATPKPCHLNSEFGEIESRYDDLIAVWTKYWNDVLTPSDPLDPNIVKALIATESSFNKKNMSDRKNPKSARGLMQVTDDSRKYLANEIKGELKDHFVYASREELFDPSINICAGIRWLFRKRQIASSILERQATWEETVYEFKGCRTASKQRAQELIKRFNDKLEEYRKCKKK